MTPGIAAVRCLPVAEWPAVDRMAWELANRPYDPFDPAAGLAAAWKAATREVNASGYGRWLNWLGTAGLLDDSGSSAQQATRANVTAYVESMKATGLAEFTVAGRLKQLGRMLQMIAPEGDWGWIVRAADRLHSKAEPSRDRRLIMQPPEDILSLGLDLMDAAENDRFRTACDRATLFRDGLLVALLVQRPIRRANLTNLTLGKDLERRDVWQIRIEDEDTKSGEPITCDWPARLIDPLERYISVHRQVLLSGAKTPSGTVALWISRQGKAMTGSAVAYQIKSRTKEEFGRAINPHTFRDVAATAIATYAPSDSAAIMDVLSHRSMRVSEKTYNRADQISAGDHYHRTLSDRMDRA